MDAIDLSRDPRVRAHLRGSTMWQDVVHLPEVTSTQDQALSRLRGGADVGVVVVADAQTAGRGRAGRGWRDAVVGPLGPGNLAVTATAAPPADHAGLVPLATGLAVADAYRSAGVQPRLKWPNDVLLADRKAAGILVERHALIDGRGVLLIGCGLDLDWRGVERSGDAAGWTSVAEHLGGEVDRAQVLVALLASLGSRLVQLGTDPVGLLAAYRPMCATVGQEVRVEGPGGSVVRGRATGIDASGRLVVEGDGGERPIDVGDVIHVRSV